MPTPKKTGDQQLDQDLSANSSLAMKVTTALIGDYSSAPALHAWLMNRESRAAPVQMLMGSVVLLAVQP